MIAIFTPGPFQLLLLGGLCFAVLLIAAGIAAVVILATRSGQRDQENSGES